MVRGSPIEVDLALTQDDARQLAGATKAQPGGKDNRNLYLVRTSSLPMHSSVTCWSSPSKTYISIHARMHASGCPSGNASLMSIQLCKRTSCDASCCVICESRMALKCSAEHLLSSIAFRGKV